MHETITNYDAFLSYSDTGRGIVDVIARLVEDAGLHVWYTPWSGVTGKSWIDAVREKIGSSRAIVVFIGRTISQWQEFEISSALQQATPRRFLILPVLLPGADDTETTMTSARKWR